MAVKSGINRIFVMNGLVIPPNNTTFDAQMSQGQKDTITTRIVSIVFTVLALAIFKPFGLDAWQWMAWVHLLAMGLMGIISCTVTEGILKYVLKKPRSYDHGVDYIIRRNLLFQLINTPLVSLLICLYRHFAMSAMVPGNVLSWSNFFETLLSIAFCSFAIGLYWRFKFRSRYLAAELEETRLLNEQLQLLQQEETRRSATQSHENQTVAADEPSHVSIPAEENVQDTVAPERMPSTVVLRGNTSETTTVHIPDLLYIEAVGNYVKIYQLRYGQVHNDMLRATSKQMEEDLSSYPMIVRCHRAFLVNLQQVERIISQAGTMQLLIKHCNESLPVSRSNMAQVKETIKKEIQG